MAVFLVWVFVVVVPVLTCPPITNHDTSFWLRITISNLTQASEPMFWPGAYSEALLFCWSQLGPLVSQLLVGSQLCF